MELNNVYLNEEIINIFFDLLDFKSKINFTKINKTLSSSNAPVVSAGNVISCLTQSVVVANNLLICLVLSKSFNSQTKLKAALALT